MPAHRLVDLIELQLHHFKQFVVEKLIKDNDLIETIDELGIERLAH